MNDNVQPLYGAPIIDSLECEIKGLATEEELNDMREEMKLVRSEIAFLLNDARNTSKEIKAIRQRLHALYIFTSIVSILLSISTALLAWR